MVYCRPALIDAVPSVSGWYALVAWGGILSIAAYPMGTLYERNRTRIIAVVDVYDALTSDRPYRKAMSPYAARTIIQRGSGADFDPAVAQALLRGFHDGAMEVPKIVR